MTDTAIIGDLKTWLARTRQPTLVRRAIAEITRLRAASEWRDISTAPRDGTIVDLWLTGGGRVTDQWWCEEDKTWCGLEEEMFSHWIIAPVEGPAPPQRNEVTK